VTPHMGDISITWVLFLLNARLNRANAMPVCEAAFDAVYSYSKARAAVEVIVSEQLRN